MCCAKYYIARYWCATGSLCFVLVIFAFWAASYGVLSVCYVPAICQVAESGQCSGKITLVKMKKNHVIFCSEKLHNYIG